MQDNFNLYYIFHSVAQHGSISKAAKILFISQPAISKSIAKLEENLNVTLFRRTSRGVQLTQEGKLLYEHTCIAFDSLFTAEAQLNKLKTLELGQIRIGVSSTLCKYLLLPFLQKFIHRYPNIKIIITCQSTFETIKLLEQEKIDLGLIGKVKDQKEITFEPIMKIEDCFVATKTYLENLPPKKKSLSFHDILENANILLLDEKNITRLYIEQYFKENNITLNQILEVSTMDLLMEFAKISLGVACVIKEFVQNDLNHGTLVEIPLEHPLEKREVGFAYSSKVAPSTAMKTFLNYYYQLKPSSS